MEKCPVPQIYTNWEKIISPDKKSTKIWQEEAEERLICRKNSDKPVCPVCKHCMGHCLGHTSIRNGFGGVPALTPFLPSPGEVSTEVQE